jgi:flagellar basal body rod protein FlgF
MCDKCHRFFVISYEKNEKGEIVEIGHELDIRIKSSGVVRVDEGEGQRGFERAPPARRYEEETCW